MRGRGWLRGSAGHAPARPEAALASAPVSACRVALGQDHGEGAEGGGRAQDGADILRDRSPGRGSQPGHAPGPRPRRVAHPRCRGRAGDEPWRPDPGGRRGAAASLPGHRGAPAPTRGPRPPAPRRRPPGPGAGSSVRGWRGRRLPRDVHTANRVRPAANTPAAVAPSAHAPAGMSLGVLSLAPSGVPPERSLGRSAERPLAGASRWPPRRDAASARSGRRPHVPGDAAYVPDLSGNRGTFPVPSRGYGRAACAWSWWPLYSGLKLGIATTPFAPETKSAGTEFFVCFQINLRKVNAHIAHFRCGRSRWEPGGVPEWLKGAGCKPAGFGLRRFESYPLHQSTAPWWRVGEESAGVAQW